MADKGKGRKKKLIKLPTGTILTDLTKLQWELLEPIGEGGFGVIYRTKKVNSLIRKNDIEFAAKVEPHGNGPLFVEKNFFLRYLKSEQLEDYKRKKKLPFLGLPHYIAGGSFIQGTTSYRFLIMERFGDNINKKLISLNSVNLDLLGLYCSQIIDSLMYIHDSGYIHMDIKPENLLLKYNSKEDKIYLIDFGVIDKCTSDKEFKPDKKKQHNGTLLYSSRDSHFGVGTKRGDLETLGYNILKWLNIDLPWAGDIKIPTIVHEKKNDFMASVHIKLQDKVPKNILEYLTYINNLKHNETPNYEYVKLLLSNLNEISKRNVGQKRKRNNVSISSSEQDISNNDDSDKKVVTKSCAASFSRLKKTQIKY